MKKIILFLSLILIVNLSYSARNPGTDCLSDSDCSSGEECINPASGGPGYCQKKF